MRKGHTICGEDSRNCPLYGKEGINEPEKCPVYRLFLLFGRKWALHLLQEFFINKKSLHFNELQVALPWITPKMISKRLTELATEGIIKRKVYSRRGPPTVEYFLTEKGQYLNKLLKEAKGWCMRWERVSSP